MLSQWFSISFGVNVIPPNRRGLHPRNKHIQRYDFQFLNKAYPALEKFVSKNEWGEDSVDFSDPHAVKILNKALLKAFYNIKYWDIPRDYLCPPVPGRADYIHHIADLLSDWDEKRIPVGANIRGLDVGVGANAIYPLIGNSEYGWSFVGSDVNSEALVSAQRIISSNSNLINIFSLRLQSDSASIFNNLIQSTDKFDFTVCNPPFHSSMADAQFGTKRKWKGLGLAKTLKNKKNFNGKEVELCYPGGEIAFIQKMIYESTLPDIKNKLLWCTTLVSKESNLDIIYNIFENELKIQKWHTIDISHGNKKSRAIAWTCHTREERELWMSSWSFS
eukprot:gene3988-7944_t